MWGQTDRCRLMCVGRGQTVCMWVAGVTPSVLPALLSHACTHSHRCTRGCQRSHGAGAGAGLVRWCRALGLIPAPPKAMPGLTLIRCVQSGRGPRSLVLRASVSSSFWACREQHTSARLCVPWGGDSGCVPSPRPALWVRQLGPGKGRPRPGTVRPGNGKYRIRVWHPDTHGRKVWGSALGPPRRGSDGGALKAGPGGPGPGPARRAPRAWGVLLPAGVHPALGAALGAQTRSPLTLLGSPHSCALLPPRSLCEEPGARGEPSTRSSALLVHQSVDCLAKLPRLPLNSGLLPQPPK